jgi:hypothetical protein
MTTMTTTTLQVLAAEQMEERWNDSKEEAVVQYVETGSGNGIGSLWQLPPGE